MSFLVFVRHVCAVLSYNSLIHFEHKALSINCVSSCFDVCILKFIYIVILKTLYFVPVLWDTEDVASTRGPVQVHVYND